MSVFLDYLEEAYDTTTTLRRYEIKHYILPIFKYILDYGNIGEDTLLRELVPTDISDTFESEFVRCDLCKEWNRIDLMFEARYDFKKNICEGCREDGS